MRNKVIYEWVINTLEGEEGDIVELNHADTLKEALQHACTAAAACLTELELVRDEGNDIDGLVDRTWAKLSHKLPEYFEYSDGRRGAKVPQRFHQEVKRSMKRNS